MTYRSAKIVPIDEAFVVDLRKQFLKYMRNVKIVDDYDSALEFKKVGNMFAKNFKELFFERFTNKSLKYYIGLGDVAVEYWGDQLRKTGWDFYIELSPPLARTDEYHGPESRYYDYTKEVRLWSNRIKHKARALWTTLRDFLEQYPHFKKPNSSEELAPHVEVLDVDNYSIAGFDVQVKGYMQGDLADYHPDRLGLAERGFKDYRKLANQRLPWLINHTLPFVLRFDTNLNKAGEYHNTFIELYMTAWVGEKTEIVGRFVKTVAHEMGHHLWNAGLSTEAQHFWSAAIRSDYDKTLDLQYILDNWDGKPDDHLAYIDDDFLDLGDVDTYLQLNTLLYSPAYRHWYERATRSDVEEKVAEGDRYISVPKHPISGYAGKNPEEAFCEAVGNYVAFGEKAVYPIIRSWLATVLPTAPIRTGDSKIMVLHVGNTVYRKAVQEEQYARRRRTAEYMDAVQAIHADGTFKNVQWSDIQDLLRQMGWSVEPSAKLTRDDLFVIIDAAGNFKYGHVTPILESLIGTPPYTSRKDVAFKLLQTMENPRVKKKQPKGEWKEYHKGPAPDYYGATAKVPPDAVGGIYITSFDVYNDSETGPSGEVYDQVWNDDAGMRIGIKYVTVTDGTKITNTSGKSVVIGEGVGATLDSRTMRSIGTSLNKLKFKSAFKTWSRGATETQAPTRTPLRTLENTGTCFGSRLPGSVG